MSTASRRPSIALVVPSLAGAGGVPVVARFLKNVILRSERFSLRLVSLAEGSAEPEGVRLMRPATWLRGVVVRRDEWDGLPFDHVGAFASELEFQRMRPRAALRPLLESADLIQVVCGSPAWANAACGLGRPVALQCATRVRIERERRDAELRGPGGWWRKTMTAVTDRLEDRALRRVDAIQVENPWMLDHARACNAGRDVDIRYAPPGIDTGWFVPPPVGPRQSPRYVLTVSRLDDPRKNIGLLLEAYAMLAPRIRATVELVLAGSALPPAAFLRRAQTLGVRDRLRVVERPDARQLRALYQGADAFALPSEEEGLGIVVLEAMACGAPVVATRCGGPEGIITDGVDGFLVPRGDARAMADRLAVLLEQEATRTGLGAQARRRIEQRYAQDVAAAPFLEMWDRMLQRAGRVRCAE